MICGMKRRGFVKTLIALPAAPALAEQQQQTASPQTPVAQPPAGNRLGGARRTVRPGQHPQVRTGPNGNRRRTAQQFFTDSQFAALRKLSELLMPPMRGMPGALECGAPEFLDFLIGASPADRQATWRTGLDTLNSRRKKAAQQSVRGPGRRAGRCRHPPVAGSRALGLRPAEGPGDALHRRGPSRHTHRHQNSREYAAAGAASGRRGGFGGGGSYINPIDPIYKG